MVSSEKSELERYVRSIAQSGLSIYDNIEIGDPNLWIPSPELELLLARCMTGISLAGLPLRSRSKVLKEHVCRALGYPVPNSFKKTKPRFPGQFFDTYGQKSNNLQVWNDELEPNRRYVIFKISDEGVIARVRVVSGDTLSKLDTTGKLTQKYQARLNPTDLAAELVSIEDTNVVIPFLNNDIDLGDNLDPTRNPASGQLLPIRTIFERTQGLVGNSFANVGSDQERNRGAELHKLVCRSLGYLNYRDDGRFPDVRHQLLEVKLQTSPTIDLGLVCPNSREPLDVPQVNGQQIRHCDVRYLVFYAAIEGLEVKLTNIYLSTGKDFFSRFPQFQGKVLNKKLQIPLPMNFFE